MWRSILLFSLLLVSTSAEAALDFDGTDDFAAKANTQANLPTVEPYSIGMWIRPDTTLGADILLEHGERADTATGWFFGTQASGALFFTTAGVKTYGPTTMTPLIADEWQFVGISMSAAFDVTFYHYRPSTETLSTETINHTAGMRTPSATADIIVGAVHLSTKEGLTATDLGAYFDGQITEVSIYNTALTAAQMALLYKPQIKQQPFNGLAYAGFKAYWPMDDQQAGSAAATDTVHDLYVFPTSNDLIADWGADLSGMLWAYEPLNYPPQGPVQGQ